MHQVDEKYFNKTLYADLNLEIIENFCRNPSRDVSGLKDERKNQLYVSYDDRKYLSQEAGVTL